MYKTMFLGASKPVNSLSTTIIISGVSCFLNALMIDFSYFSVVPYLSILAFQNAFTLSSALSNASSSPSRVSGAEIITSEVTFPISSKYSLYLIAVALFGATNCPLNTVPCQLSTKCSTISQALA